jgi:hypothetical protein
MLLILIDGRITRVLVSIISVERGEIGVGLWIDLRRVLSGSVCVFTITGGQVQGGRLNTHFALNGTGMFSCLLEKQAVGRIDL